MEKLHLRINTSANNISIEGAASLILAQIDKGSWLEKRKVILPTKGE